MGIRAEQQLLAWKLCLENHTAFGMVGKGTPQGGTATAEHQKTKSQTPKTLSSSAVNLVNAKQSIFPLIRFSTAQRTPGDHYNLCHDARKLAVPHLQHPNNISQVAYKTAICINTIHTASVVIHQINGLLSQKGYWYSLTAPISDASKLHRNAIAYKHPGNDFLSHKYLKDISHGCC